MNADEFMVAFNEAVEAIWPARTGKQWTQGMYEVLIQVGNRQDFIMRYKGSSDGGEKYNLDFVFYEKREGVKAENNWNMPSVVIEHENLFNEYETANDFWKLCHFYAPLRVMIGYQEKEYQAKRAGENLIALSQKWNWHQSKGVDTLLIMGWHQSTPPRQWHVWHLRGLGSWTPYLQENEAPLPGWEEGPE